MPAYGHTSTAPPLASQPAGPRVSDHLSASFRGLSSVCSGDWSKTKKTKKAFALSTAHRFEASLLLCIESFARHTIRRPAASLPVRVRPELRAERYRRPQRVRRAQSPAWFTLPSEVTLSLSRSPSGLVSLGGCSAFQANRGAPYAKVGDFGHKSGS
jgi:hypothetical protein